MKNQALRRQRDGATAGIGAGVVFAVVMLADLAVTRSRINDFRLIGGIGPLARFWKVTGPLIHAANSAVVGITYGTVEPRLPGPGWLRGLLFTLTENMLLWPIVVLLDRTHPAIRAGELPRFNTRMGFAVEMLRHAAYGVALGILFERSQRVTERHTD